ncbi:C40 family peptidase [Paenibacillus turpanensis]|uniref:C40 family peptidase n=1 Tax=Paenibacillus turpanensis TaxID=2689078 RepID=UPI001FB6E218|nr:SH3 domain-containing C40 family peptidase [Paenibacillus turpanensis]
MKRNGTRKTLLLTLSATLFAGTAFVASTTEAQAATSAQVISGVNFRTEPSTSGDKIRMLSKSETVTIVDKVNSYWYKIKDHKGVTGYVSTSEKYLKLEEPEVEIDANGEVVRSVSFRKGPSTDYDRIRYLKSGEDIEIIDEVNNYWYKIKDQNGEIGYVSSNEKYIESDYVSVSAAASQSKSALIDKVVQAGMNYLGTPYEFGSNRNTTKTFDCSDLVRHIYKEGADIVIPTNSRSQGDFIKDNGTVVKSISQLKRGDLIFFMAYKGIDGSNYEEINKSSQRITHVAMYLGNGKMLNTYSNKSGGVIIDTLDSHWVHRFLFGGSVIK